jgi:hypothetical protein
VRQQLVVFERLAYEVAAAREAGAQGGERRDLAGERRARLCRQLVLLDVLLDLLKTLLTDGDERPTRHERRIGVIEA